MITGAKIKVLVSPPIITVASGRCTSEPIPEDLSIKWQRVVAMYIAGHPSVQGRVMFAFAEPGTPESATVRIKI
ncbi:hypothetical protein GCM10007423_11970 [Dyadobacter endophyticus]|uniref:Uncharacterized protein n=1 Tax=Dyadobacter endophyticus TaxID=1749036 RepID=A0ABQ1YJB5_9BACT|nr:hypothetical protein GCM10007423_11970 [Dyadobacter endophyticus]